MTEQHTQDAADTAHEYNNHKDTDQEDDDYAGSATLVVDNTEIGADVRLRGYFQPIDGYYHWYGRVRPNEMLTKLAAGRKKAVEIRTPRGTASGEISDPDPWGRYRITGTSTPPFPTPTSLDELAE